MRQALGGVLATPQSLPRVGVFRFRAPLSGRIVAVEVYTDTVNVTGATTLDVNLAGVTIFTDQTTRPSIAANASQSIVALGGAGVAVTKGQLITADIDVAPIGGTGVPLYLTVFISDGLLERAIVVTATPVIANGAIANIVMPLGKGFGVSYVQTDFAARVRGYSKIAYRTADAGRISGVLPTGEHGVLFEAQTEAADLTKEASPDALCLNKERDGSGVVLTDVALAVTNLSGASRAITVTIERLLMEI